MSVLVIVPTLGDRADYLDLALSSIRSQQVPDLDVVLVTPSAQRVSGAADRWDARLVADPGTGLSAALNAGLDAAAPGTDFVCWLGDDDLLTDGSLRRTVSYLQDHPESVMVYGWCDYIDAEGQVIFRSRAGRLAAAILGWGPNLIPQPGSLMRMSAVAAAGGLDESLRLAMDLDLFLRLRPFGRISAVPATLACFRWHGDSATVRSEQVSMEESDQIRMRQMGPIAGRAYRVLRWPGRLALWLAKRHVARRSAAAAKKAAGRSRSA